jgi:hypothetical protein
MAELLQDLKMITHLDIHTRETTVKIEVTMAMVPMVKLVIRMETRMATQRYTCIAFYALT